MQVPLTITYLFYAQVGLDNANRGQDGIVHNGKGFGIEALEG